MNLDPRMIRLRREFGVGHLSGSIFRVQVWVVVPSWCITRPHSSRTGLAPLWLWPSVPPISTRLNPAALQSRMTRSTLNQHWELCWVPLHSWRKLHRPLHLLGIKESLAPPPRPKGEYCAVKNIEHELFFSLWDWASVILNAWNSGS